MKKRLTKAEEQIMHILWGLEQATIKEIIEKMPYPKPAYNTVSTIVRILENKQFVAHRPLGKGYQYYPILGKESYSKQSIKNLVDGYFEGSFKSLVSFFVKKNDVDIEDLERVLNELKKDKK